MSNHLHHDHHDHHHIPKSKTILLISLVIITSYMLVEFWGDIIFYSLTLMADAGHMANDSFSLLLALGCAVFMKICKNGLRY